MSTIYREIKIIHHKIKSNGQDFGLCNIWLPFYNYEKKTLFKSKEIVIFKNALWLQIVCHV